MNPYYECHITIKGDRNVIKPLVEITPGWKFSCIDGDPAFGEVVLCYAAAHFNGSFDHTEVVREMHKVADSLKSMGLNVAREKVEFIVYDSRQEKRA